MTVSRGEGSALAPFFLLAEKGAMLLKVPESRGQSSWERGSYRRPLFNGPHDVRAKAATRDRGIRLRDSGGAEAASATPLSRLSRQ